MSNLYQDAILDAKALRASAMANAKAALEEAFEPKIQEMISKHLSEEAVEENLEEEWNEDGVKEGEMHGEEKPMEETADINEAELEEILNQLEEMSKPEVEESLNEAEEDEADEDEDEEEAPEGDDEEGEEAEEVTDETKVIEITVGDLKQILQSVMPGQEMPAAEPEGPEAGDEMAASLEEVSLEEILDELSMEEGQGYEMGKQHPKIEEEGGAINEATFAQIWPIIAGAVGVFGLGGFITFIQNALKSAAEDGDKTAQKAYDAMAGVGKGAASGIKKSPGIGPGPTEAKELEEAKATIETLRRDLQEVNLLNAKYLYMNKLFKGKSLTEAQKLKVINTLDKATTVKEVKTAYELMNESFSTNKGQLKESVGFASKPAGVAPKANIVEADQFVSRWQKLAGIK